MKKLFIIIGLILSGCTLDNPKWLVIEYPIENDNTIMKFPGVEADVFEECVRQVDEIKKTRTKNFFGEVIEYNGKFQCGSNCRFSKELGGPVCDELKDV